MGWNDRLPEDPNIPYESPADRDAYDNWRMYVEGLLDDAENESGLSSNNIRPGAEPPQLPHARPALLTWLRRVMTRLNLRRTHDHESSC